MEEISREAGSAPERASEVRAFATLRQLGLSDPELAALRHQGYVQQDHRGAEGTGYFRLRFRLGQSMRTVYLGRDEQLIEQVRCEVRALQHKHHLHRQAVDLAKQGRQKLRTAKQQLAGVLQQLCMYYHGDTIRKSRPSRQCPESQSLH